MAYSIKPTYEPMTFQEMLQPYAVYGAEEERQNDAYMKLLEDARGLEDLKDSDVDSEEYNKYVDFKNRINSMVDEIATTGLSRQTRSNLNKYRAEYQSDFANMVDRIKRRGELVKQQRAYLAEHPNAFFDVDYSNTPASEVMEGSSYTPYDMDAAANNMASKVYSLMSAKGNDITESDMSNIISAERDRYNYANLSDRNKSMVDSALSLGIMTANKTYTDNINKQAIDNAKLMKAEADAYKSMYGKYKGTGVPVGRAGGSVTKKGSNKIGYAFADGTVVEFSKSQNINGETVWTYKDSQGKIKMATQEQIDNLNTDDGFRESVYENVSGITSRATTNAYGQNIEVVVDTDGNTKVKNKNGKYVVPKSFDDKGYYMAYMGINEDDLKPYMKNVLPARYKPNGDTLSKVDYQDDYESDSGADSSSGKKYIPVPDFNIMVSSNGQKGNAGFAEYKSKYEDLKVRAGNLGGKIDEYIKKYSGSKDVESALVELYRAGMNISVVMYAKHGNPNKMAYMEINLKYTNSGRSYEASVGNNNNNNNNENEGGQNNNELPAIDI